jgi:hypothetical protein
MCRFRLRHVLACVAVVACVGCHSAGEYAYKGHDYNATLVVYRLPSITLAAMPAYVALDGAVIAELGQNDFVVIQLAPGRHELRLKADTYPRADAVVLEARDLDWLYYEAEPNAGIAVAATASIVDPTIVGTALGALFMRPFLLRASSDTEFRERVDGLEQVPTGGGAGPGAVEDPAASMDDPADARQSEAPATIPTLRPEG